MPSQAKQRYDTNDTDVGRLLDIHGIITQGVRGRHHNLSALHKSSLIMMSACWEAYVEDIVVEATTHMLANIADASQVPAGLRHKIADEIRQEKDVLGTWKLSGEGWKAVVKAKVEQLCDGLNGGLNTPSPKNVATLSRVALGMNITDAWAWRGMNNDSAKAKLLKLIKARGSVAHGQAVEGLRINICTGFRTHIAKLVEVSDEAVNAHMLATYGQPLF